MDIQLTDFFTIGLLVVLEALLSADNALVLAILVMGLPAEQQSRALRYGLLAAFGFRLLAVALAAYLLQAPWLRLLGGAYLLYLAVQYFVRHQSSHAGRSVPAAKAAWGLSPFWATVVRVEAINVAFSVDSILVAVAMSPKLWVVVTGGIIGIVAMRVVAGQLIKIIERYPAIVDGAFVIIAWVGFKLVAEYAHAMRWIDWEVPRALSLGLIGIIFLASYIYARSKGPASSRESS